MKANNFSESEDFTGNYVSNLGFPAASQRDKLVHKRSVSDQPNNPFAIKLQIRSSDFPADSPIFTEIQTKELCCERDTEPDYSQHHDKEPNCDTPISPNPMCEENICLQRSQAESYCGGISTSIDRKAAECSLISIENCENAILMRCKELTEKCENFAEEQTALLSHTKKEMQTAIYLGLAESKGKIMDWDTSKMSPVGSLFTSSSATDYRNLALFRYEELETEVSFGDCVGIQWECSGTEKGRVGAEGEIDIAGKSAKNPLFFPDVNSFVAACLSDSAGERLDDPFQYQMAYFQSVTEMLQSKEESYREVMERVTLEQGVEAWIQLGTTIFRDKVRRGVPEAQVEELAKRLATTFRSQQDAKDAETRNADLKAAASSLAVTKGLKVPQVPFSTKRRRGRPPKRTFPTESDHDFIRKRQRSKRYSVIDGSVSVFEYREDVSYSQGADGEEVRERSEGEEEDTKGEFTVSREE